MESEEVKNEYQFASVASKFASHVSFPISIRLWCDSARGDLQRFFGRLGLASNTVCDMAPVCIYPRGASERPGRLWQSGSSYYFLCQWTNHRGGRFKDRFSS